MTDTKLDKWQIFDRVLDPDMAVMERRLRELLPTRGELTGWLRSIQFDFPTRGMTTDQVYRGAAYELRSGSAGFLT